jgi:hypothetical protein
VDLSSLVGQSWGGGAMYNGDYYLFDDEGGQQGIVKMTFDSKGLIDSVTKPWGNSSTVGQLGDIAISSSGMLYVLTNTSYELYQKDLNVAGSTFTKIGDYGSRPLNGQLLIDSEGRLMSAGSSNGLWYQLDPNGSSQVLATFTGPSGSVISYDDMAAVGPVPEPASYAMMLAGLLSLGMVRRRRMSR